MCAFIMVFSAWFSLGAGFVVLVRARVSVEGSRGRYESVALVDTGARMTLIDEGLAEELGAEYTGRRLSFMSITGHRLYASEAVVHALRIEDELLRFEAVAVAKLPGNVKRTLRENQVDENIVIGLLTLERANLIPDTATGVLRKIEAFMI